MHISERPNGQLPAVYRNTSYIPKIVIAGTAAVALVCAATLPAFLALSTVVCSIVLCGYIIKVLNRQACNARRGCMIEEVAAEEPSENLQDVLEIARFMIETSKISKEEKDYLNLFLKDMDTFKALLNKRFPQHNSPVTKGEWFLLCLTKLLNTDEYKIQFDLIEEVAAEEPSDNLQDVLEIARFTIERSKISKEEKDDWNLMLKDMDTFKALLNKSFPQHDSLETKGEWFLLCLTKLLNPDQSKIQIDSID